MKSIWCFIFSLFCNLYSVALKPRASSGATRKNTKNKLFLPSNSKTFSSSLHVEEEIRINIQLHDETNCKENRIWFRRRKIEFSSVTNSIRCFPSSPCSRFVTSFTNEQKMFLYPHLNVCCHTVWIWCNDLHHDYLDIPPPYTSIWYQISPRSDPFTHEDPQKKFCS